MSIWERYNETAMTPFNIVADKYLDNFDGKDKHRQSLALNSVRPYIGAMPIIDVNDSALEPFKRDRLAGTGHFTKPVMAGTVNKELTAVSTVLNRACRDWDMLPRVPRIRQVKGEKRIPYPLTWDEQERLFSQFYGYERCAWLFAVNTGVRKGELFGLKWSDMRPVPELDTFVFILTDTKNGQDRAVICNSIARRCVNHMRDNGSELVFPSRFARTDSRGRSRTYKIRQSGKVFSAAWLAAGLPSDPLIRKGAHNLRHTFGQRLRAAGVSEEDRALLLGHANASLVQHYAAGDIKRLTESAELVTTRTDSVILRAHA